MKKPLFAALFSTFAILGFAEYKVRLGNVLEQVRYIALDFCYICKDMSKEEKRWGVMPMVYFLRLLALQPLKVHYFWGKCLSWIAENLIRYRRDTVMINLARSFPEKKYKEIGQIATGFYHHFGRLVAETVWFAGAYNIKRLVASHICTISNPQFLNELYASTPGVVILTSHFGNWEIIGGVMNYAGKDGLDFDESRVTVVYKHLESGLWDGVMRYNRCSPIRPEHYGLCYVETWEILRFMVAHRKEKRLYIFPTDQCPYKRAGSHEVADFMHQKTLTMTGGAAIARKFGMAVCYMSLKEKRDGVGYEMEFKEICRDANVMTPEDIMNDFYKYLEEDICVQPSNYLWTHKRWKK